MDFCSSFVQCWKLFSWFSRLVENMRWVITADFTIYHSTNMLSFDCNVNIDSFFPFNRILAILNSENCVNVVWLWQNDWQSHQNIQKCRTFQFQCDWCAIEVWLLASFSGLMNKIICFSNESPWKVMNCDHCIFRYVSEYTDFTVMKIDIRIIQNIEYFKLIPLFCYWYWNKIE